jgi:hypothetical protein
MKLKRIALGIALGLVALAAALGSTSTVEAAGKPGLTPGTWKGTGVISGSVTDAAGTTRFTGKLGFRLVVSKKRWVKGTGSWVRTMVGTSEFVRSRMVGIAKMTFAGPSNEIDILYAEDVEGFVEDAFGRKTPVAFNRGGGSGPPTSELPLRNDLIVKRVQRCTASGIIPTGEGMKITWTAKAAGCR